MAVAAGHHDLMVDASVAMRFLPLGRCVCVCALFEPSCDSSNSMCASDLISSEHEQRRRASQQQLAEVKLIESDYGERFSHKKTLKYGILC